MSYVFVYESVYMYIYKYMLCVCVHLKVNKREQLRGVIMNVPFKILYYAFHACAII